MASINFNQVEISLAIGRVQLAKLPQFLSIRRAFADAVAEGMKSVKGVELVAPPEGGQSAYWFLLFRIDPTSLACSNEEFAIALMAEGIEGVYGGYPFFPTDMSWHEEAIVYGSSGLPWSLVQQSPCRFPLPNAHAANQRMVRVDVHERLADADAGDLVTAVSKIARHYAVS